jgi:hypothetical protein
MREATREGEATALLALDAKIVGEHTATMQNFEIVRPGAPETTGTASTSAPERPRYGHPLGVEDPGDSTPKPKGSLRIEPLGYAGAFFYLSNVLTGPGFFGLPKTLQVRQTH